MHRRSFLAAVAAALGGCSSLAGEETPTGTLTPAPVPSETPTPTPAPFEGERHLASAAVGRSAVGGRTVSLFPPRYGSPDVDVLVEFDAPATADHPARLRAFLRHREEQPTVVPFEHPPFAPRTRFDAATVDGDPGVPGRLFLVPTPDSPVARRVPEVELAHGGDSGVVWRLASAPTDWLPERGRVPGDRALSATFHLVAGPDATAPPTGRYRGEASERGPATLVAWDTDAPGPTAGSRFARDRALPPLPGERSARWFHHATPETPVYLRPSTEHVDVPDRMTVTLVNHSRDGVGASDWSFYRLEDGTWYELGPLFREGAVRFLPPGGRFRWRFALAHDGSAGGSTAEDVARLPHLGGGTYAVAAGRAGEDRRPASLVELEAPALALRPTTDARTTRDGDTVRVRSDPPPGDDGDEPVVLLLDRLPLGGGTATPRPTVTPVDERERGLRRLVTEQVMQSRGLRNTLAFAEPGVETVRLLTTDTVVRRALRRVEFRADSRRFRYDDGRFRVTVDRVRDTGTVAPGHTVTEAETPTDPGADG